METALTLTTDMKLVLGLVSFTMVMFLFERIRPDVVALVVLVLLGLTGLVAPEELFNGFATNAVGSTDETLYVSDSSFFSTTIRGLARIDLATMTLTPVAGSKRVRVLS